MSNCGSTWSNYLRIVHISLIVPSYEEFCLKLNTLFNSFVKGDGNLHLNITAKEFDYELHNIIEPYVFEWTSELKGSVSAEHGIGFKKTKFIHYSKSHSAISLMKQIKQIMDPKGIMNPYKVLPK